MVFYKILIKDKTSLKNNDNLDMINKEAKIMKLSEMTIKEYSEVLGAKKPTPGGGSALALVCELAIDLALMVVNFTIDKKGYENVREEISSYMETLQELKNAANSLIDKDGEAYAKVVQAYKSGIKEQLNEASIEACEVPYSLYMIANQTKFINRRLTIIGNKTIITDAIIGIELANSVLVGCLENIKCNISGISDDTARQKYLDLFKKEN